MHHQDFHELLALDLYGELDSPARERLAAHLADCSECRAFAVELERGLGRLAGAAVEGDLPADWRLRLQHEIEFAARRSRAPRSFALGAAIGLAAGLLIAWGIVAATPAMPSGRPATYTASNSDAARSLEVELTSGGAPPKAQAGGELARLRRYLRK